MKDTRDHILRIIEEDVDGCGSDAVTYVMFSKPLDDNIKARFEQHLIAVKERTAGEDYDTDDMVEEAIEDFNKSVIAISRHITAEQIGAPYFGVIEF